MTWPAPKRDFDPSPCVAAVTPSNTALLTGTVGDSTQTVNITTRFLRIGGAGNVYVDVAGNNGVYLSDGSVNPLAYATGTLEVDTASGTVGGVVNGVSCTVTADPDDSVTATAIAAAITAAAATTFATATADGTTVTITSTVPGKMGNALSLAATGTGITAGGSYLAGATGGSGNYVKYAVVAGEELRIRAIKVYALGTTATNIVAEW